MDNKYQYDPIATAEEIEIEKSWTPCLRQLLVCSGALTIYLSVGIFYGAPTIFIQQIRNEANCTDAVSVEMASWLSSAFGYASVPWIFINTALGHVYGRKKAFLLVSFSTIITFICFYLSETTTHLLCCTILQGMTHATCFTVSLLILTEYTSPRYIGVFLTMKAASVYWGIWFSNAIGTFTHWKYIALFGLVCSSFSLTAFIWPESPYWLASKGRFEECKRAHRWLKGTGVEAEKELLNMTTGKIDIVKLGSIKQIRDKQFYMPTLISGLMILQCYASGKIVASIYAIDILEKITNSKSAAYTAMLILDGATVFSMYIGCMLNRYIRRRVQLFTTAFLGALFIFLLSLYLYLVKLNVLTDNNIATTVILVMYSITMGCGPAIMAGSTFGEIIPTKYKNLCTIIISLWVQMVQATMLKTFPSLYLACGLHGIFLCYGVAMTILTIILYYYLPETKDKPLQEIENYFIEKKYKNTMFSGFNMVLKK